MSDLTRAEVERYVREADKATPKGWVNGIELYALAQSWLTLEARVRELELEKETRYLASKKPREDTQK